MGMVQVVGSTVVFVVDVQSLQISSNIAHIVTCQPYQRQKNIQISGAALAHASTTVSKPCSSFIIAKRLRFLLL